MTASNLNKDELIQGHLKLASLSSPSLLQLIRLLESIVDVHYSRVSDAVRYDQVENTEEDMGRFWNKIENLKKNKKFGEYLETT